MKLNYEDKVKIYRLKKSGVSWTQLEIQFGVNYNVLKYLVQLMDCYVLESVQKRKNITYPLELK